MGAAVAVVGVAQAAPALLADIEGLFQGSSFDATHQQILAWSNIIGQDLALQGAAAQNAWLLLRCWSGDQSVITTANTSYLFGAGYTAAQRAMGCGCETAHGCRQDAAAAVAYLRGKMAAVPKASTMLASAGTTASSLLGGASTGTLLAIVVVILFILYLVKK